MTASSKTDYATVVDAREIEGEPFGEIVSALGGLADGETMLLVNSFEPEPLYAVLDERGFEFDATSVAADEWHLEITPA
jgi:uncharacterized protein (DUF2249 family)